MHWQTREPTPWPHEAGVVVVEGEPGEARDAVVERWLACGEASGPTWRLHCRPQDGAGLWAGMSTLIEDVAGTLRERAPDLLARHAHELSLVLPAMKSELVFAQSLTDTVQEEEKTRNYAADRAYRSLHGLIDMLSAWHELTDPGPCSIACDGYDDANGLVQRFFSELVRRRGAQLGLRLLVVADPGHGEDVAATLHPSAITAAVRLALPRDDTTDRSPEEMASLAQELQRQLPDDPAAREARLAQLIDAWQRSSTPERALRWQLVAMERYNHAGLYEASLPYAADVEAGLERLWAEDRALYFGAVNILYFCYVPLDRAEAMVAILEQILTRVDDAADTARYCYLLSMLHARFLQPPDQDVAEALLQQALGVLDDAKLPEHERHFLTVFTMNGLAFVRLRQRRAQEALDLCATGIARLNEHLDPDRHRLHRSVLLFNIAQVHAQIGPYEDAIAYFTQAMAMDPNYSEYYNDRGAVHFKMDNPLDAERDYLRAIELSPPYAEVWTNLGQCYRQMERMPEAIAAYTRALDLDPGCTLALVGRADAYADLDRADLALGDYDQALTLEPDQPLVLGSRAIVHYQAGRVAEALADLDAAIAVAPDVAELYQNRAVALQELDRHDDAVRDLTTYLRLQPDAEDRDEVESSLLALAGAR
jgi:tetratricopeptide (TPR) repeat protein